MSFQAYKLAKSIMSDGSETSEFQTSRNLGREQGIADSFTESPPHGEPAFRPLPSEARKRIFMRPPE